MVVAQGSRTEPGRAVRRVRSLAPFAGCVAVAVAIRAPYGRVPLGIDEGGVAAIAQQWLNGGHGELYGSAFLDRPPLLVLLYKLALVPGAGGIRLLGAAAAAALVLVVAALAGALAGRRASVAAAVLAAVLSGSAALAAVFTTGELLAAVPAAASVLCLVLAQQHADDRWLLGAGALAVAAALIKQSFLDAGVAGVAFLVARGATSRHVPWRPVGAYAVGAAVPLAAVVAWQVAAHPPDHGLLFALFGFRIAALDVLQGSSQPVLERMHSLAHPAVRSGLIVPLAATPLGLSRLRANPVLLATLTAWLVGCLVGVAGGGSYWPHYLIQLVAVSAVGAALLLIAVPAGIRNALLLGVVAVALVTAAGRWSSVPQHPPHSGSLAVARWVRDHARPGDTQWVMYAHANVGYYTGLPTPYPYAWSLMVRSIPDARPRLRQMLASPQRPTWVIRWQLTRAWGLDRRHRTLRLLRRHYVTVATVRGRGIMLRRDVARARGVTTTAPAQAG